MYPQVPQIHRVDKNNVFYAGCRKTTCGLITEGADVNRTGADLYGLIVAFVRMVF